MDSVGAADDVREPELLCDKDGAALPVLDTLAVADAERSADADRDASGDFDDDAGAVEVIDADGLRVGEELARAVRVSVEARDADAD